MIARVPQKRRSLDERADEIGARLSSQLADARRMKGWSEDRLAKAIGVDSEAVSQLELGTGSVATLVVAMAALDFHLTGIAPGNTLGEQIGYRRKKGGQSIEALAAKAKMSGAIVEDLEHGRGDLRDLFRVLALLAPGVRRRAPERAYWGQGDKAGRDSRFTPAAFMASIYDAFGKVDLDPCAHRLSPVVAARRIILTEGGDGLTDDWSGRLAFVNPPYSAQLKWLQRAYEQWSAGNVETVLCLLPVRTDNKFFHETLHREADLFLLKGRLRFASEKGDPQPTPFSLWIVALGATAAQKARFAELVPGCWFRATGAVPAVRTVATSCRAADIAYTVRCTSAGDRRSAGGRPASVSCFRAPAADPMRRHG